MGEKLGRAEVPSPQEFSAENGTSPAAHPGQDRVDQRLTVRIGHVDHAGGARPHSANCKGGSRSAKAASVQPAPGGGFVPCLCGDGTDQPLSAPPRFVGGSFPTVSAASCGAHEQKVLSPRLPFTPSARRSKQNLLLSDCRRRADPTAEFGLPERVVSGMDEARRAKACRIVA